MRGDALSAESDWSQFDTTTEEIAVRLTEYVEKLHIIMAQEGHGDMEVEDNFGEAIGDPELVDGVVVVADKA